MRKVVQIFNFTKAGVQPGYGYQAKQFKGQ